MRKLVVVLILALTAFLGALLAPQAQAAGQYPDVTGLTPFTQGANYMSLPGYLRWQHLLKTGRWISRQEAEQAVRDQGKPIGPA
ncbi:MAG: hypothetical protein M3347_18580 [Armatimonadota bacterium]|nr:hypothetical protein [Armatimonadota bacterium]